LSRRDALLYGAIVSFAERTGIWSYPMRCHGDVADMGFLDKAYWVYKAGRPIVRARRGSGIEEYFAARRTECATLPAGFRTDEELTLSAVGDLMTHAYLGTSRDVLFRDVADLIFGADISMANVECVLCPPVTKELVISFDDPPSLYYDEPAFLAAKGPEGKGFRFVAAACNHSLDFGEVGVDGTIRTLEEAGIAFGGLTPRDGDPRRATILEHGGMRVGAVAYTFGLNARKPPADRPHIVHRMALNEGIAANDFEQLKMQIAHCEAERVDFLVGQLHWGLEHEFYPVPEQIELAHHLAELGVDAIIGHHPHVVQPMELYRTRRDPHRLVPIYYSLGNLITPFSARHACESAVARITLAKGTLDGGSARTYVKAADLIRVTQVVDEARRQIHIIRTTERTPAKEREGRARTEY
jgi:poly-gamma-glutamate synthesis protein (capsule biosynthesis protein)